MDPAITSFRVLTGNEEHCQKVLNQWKHQFEIEIIGLTYYRKDLAILLTITKKEAK